MFGHVVALMLLCLGQAVSAAPAGGEASAAELIRTDLEFAQAAAARGLPGWLSFFADDAVIAPEHGPIVRGLDAIRAHYAATGFSPAGLVWTPEHAEAAASGDLGYTFGTWRWTGRDAEGKPISAQGKYVTVWRKQPDGRWKVALDFGNTEPARP